MVDENKKMMRAREILNTIIEGKNPYTYDELKEDCILNDPRMIRCLLYIVKVLTDNIENSDVNKTSNYRVDFYITEQELSNVVLPGEDVGINDFCKAINNVIDIKTRKRLSGTKISSQLRKMGILTEVKDKLGHSRTTVTEHSHKYGIKTVKSTFDGVEYDKVVFTKEGQEFLLNNLINILNYDEN